MKLADLQLKFRRFFGAVMLVVAVPAIGSGVFAWRRGSEMAVLGTVYMIGGAYLVYEGLVLVLRKPR